MAKKKKKEPKDEKLVDDASQVENQEELVKDTSEMSDEEKLILGVDSNDKDEMTEFQKQQLEKLNSVKQKISKILKSSNIEIVDENAGDEYESDSSGDGEGKKQQDYDSLKALFGNEDDKKNKELTLTIDDYDYTYTGQYLDEFDMMHLKNIKRIRLQNKYAKQIKKISLIASIVLVVIIGAVVAFMLTRETPVYLKSISLNHTEGQYYINDYFDYSGLYIIAEYSNGKTEKIKLNSSHLQSTLGNIVQSGDVLQFTGTAPVELRFGYGGKTTTYMISVENKRVSGLKVVYSDGLFNLEVGDEINGDILRPLLKYSNFNTTFVELDNSFDIFINNRECDYNSTKKSFIASVSTKPDVIGEMSNAEIRVVYSSYSVIINNIAGQYIVDSVIV